MNLLDFIVEIEHQRDGDLLLQSPAKVHDAWQALQLLFRHRADLCNSYKNIKEFMDQIPRAVGMRAVISELCLEYHGLQDVEEQVAQSLSAMADRLLFYAADTDDEVSVKLLLDVRADPAFLDPDEGSTPLMAAAENGNKGLVETLIKAGSPCARKPAYRTRTRERTESPLLSRTFS